MTTTTETSWRGFFSIGGLAIAVFAGGTTLQAMEAFITSAMLPTVVRDIGGLDYFAWNTTLFIVASIAAANSGPTERILPLAASARSF